MKIKLLNYCLSAVVGLGLYFALYLPLELFLTEFWFITPKINPWINTGVLLFFLLVANLFAWEKIVNKKGRLIILVALVVFSFAFYGFYHHIKLTREYLPKIYQVRPSWVIQGQPLEIKGVNFGPTFKKGKIIVDGMEFLVDSWTENKIVAEAPVPCKTGYFYLYLETKEGKKSNLWPFEVKDPNYLKRYLR